MRPSLSAVSILIPLVLGFLAGDPAVGEDSAAERDESWALDGRDIYDRFLDNKHKESHQRIRVISRDPGGNELLTEAEVSLQDFRDEQDQPVDGVRAKVLIEVTAPFDIRHTAYLVIVRDEGSDDEFVYQPSARRVRRVDLRNTSLFGTDFTAADVGYRSIDDARYRRLPDEVVQGKPVFVVESRVKDEVDSDYRKIVTYIEKQHYVALRARFWDRYDVEIKELTAPAASMRRFGQQWITTETTIRDLRQGTSSTLYVDELETDPGFHKKIFAVSRLAQGN